MKNFVRLNKNEMKMVLGGVEEEIEDGTECILKCNMDCPCKDTRDWCDNGECKSRN